MNYSKYKQGNTPWLEEIPEHWEITKIGRIASKIGSGKTPRGGAETYAESGVIFIRSQNVYNEGLRLNEVTFIDNAVDEEMSETRVYLGDVLLNITGASLGRCSLVAEDIGRANVNQHVCIIRPDISRVNPAFLWLAVASSSTENQIFSYENGSSREGLNFQQVRDLLVPLPSISEQEDIVQFLGNRLNKIDILVRKKEELIEKLQEKRSALISRTVTRGLPPEAAKAAGLDPHPKMKDSGIEWLGEIPVHWRETSVWLECFARNLEIQDGNHGELHPKADDYASDGIPFVMANHIADGKIDFQACNYIPLEVADSLRIGFSKVGDVLLTHKGTIGRVALVEKHPYPYIMLTPQVTYYRSLRGILNRYLFWIMEGNYWQDQMHLISDLGATRAYIGLLDQKRLLFALPPIDEQGLIANYLNFETRKIDPMIEKVKAAIEKLTEYRSALITAAVTGKIDVRNYTGD